MSQWSDNLKIELLDTGDSNWGNLTNNNFKWALEDSITGYATVTFPSDANYDWAALYTNSNSSQEQRNLVLNVVGTLSTTRELIVPTIEKQYIVQNNTTGGQAITVKTSAGAGVTVPNGSKMHVYVDGTNVIQMADYDVTRTIGTLSLTNALSVANGGTGITAFGTGVVTALGQNVTGSGGIVLATSPTLVTPTLGVATATSINKVALTAPATAATITIANNKTFTVNHSLTLAGTDTTTMTFPSTNATIARTDAAQTFTGVQTFSSDAAINGLTVGRGAGAVATNTALGSNALGANTNGAENLAIGYHALQANTTNNRNTAVGVYAIGLSNGGSDCTAIGWGALYSCAASSSTAVGWSALVNLTSGGNNTAIGLSAGFNVITGANNIFVGSNTGSLFTNGLNQIVIGVGLTSKGSGTSFIGGSSGIYNQGNTSSWQTVSDERIKKNIADNNDGLEKISAIRVRNFEYRTPEEISSVAKTAAVEKQGVQLGVIAQEMPAEFVTQMDGGVLSVSPDKIVWYLVNAVKELSAQVKALQSQLK